MHGSFVSFDARDVVEDLRAVLNRGLLRNPRLIAVFRDVVVSADEEEATSNLLGQGECGVVGAVVAAEPGIPDVETLPSLLPKR